METRITKKTIIDSAAPKIVELRESGKNPQALAGLLELVAKLPSINDHKTVEELASQLQVGEGTFYHEQGARETVQKIHIGTRTEDTKVEEVFSDGTIRTTAKHIVQKPITIITNATTEPSETLVKTPQVSHTSVGGALLDPPNNSSNQFNRNSGTWILWETLLHQVVSLLKPDTVAFLEVQKPEHVRRIGTTNEILDESLYSPEELTRFQDQGGLVVYGIPEKGIVKKYLCEVPYLEKGRPRPRKTIELLKEQRNRRLGLVI